MRTHNTYMQRCIQLAKLGAGWVAPNPMVGAVLVHNHRIIGEGYHACYGQAHAEVNCLASVAGKDKHLIPNSRLYVSLEPCAHWGKTPPCADLILQNNIPEVVIGCRDPFAEVDGKGIQKLTNAGVQVTTGVLQQECLALNKRFFTYHQQQRPYVVLKWAQTRNGIIGTGTGERLQISNDVTNRLVHKWRSEEQAILVGTNTALLDNPSLTNRWWHGKNPVRLVLDMHLRLPHHLALFTDGQPTIVLNGLKDEADGGLVRYIKLDTSRPLAGAIAHACHQLKLQSVLVEGGRQLLQTFIDERLWDEARVITNTALVAGGGTASAVLHQAAIHRSFSIGSDSIATYIRATLPH